MAGLVWALFFTIFVTVMIIAVPRREIIRLLPLGLFGGFGQSLIILGLLVAVLGLWKFNYSDIFSVAGIPVFIALSWVPEVVIYAYYLSRLSNGENLAGKSVITYITVFSLATGLFVHWLQRAGFIIFFGWNSLLTFLLALVLHLPVTYYLIKVPKPHNGRLVLAEGQNSPGDE